MSNGLITYNNHRTINSETSEFSDNYYDILEKLKIFEKKINNLTKELELKDIQIKSQEQMITRRNKELEDLKDEKNRGLRTQQSNKDSHNIDEKINKSMNNSKVKQ